MLNQPIHLRPLRILSPATAPGDPPPDQARSARFRSLMTAVSASRPDENEIVQANDGDEILTDNEDGNAPAAAAESLPLVQLAQPTPLPSPPGQANAPACSERYDADPPIPRESAADAEPGAQHDEIHALPLTDHEKRLAANHRIAANRAPSFSVRGSRPLTPHTDAAADSRMPSADTPNDDDPSRLDLLTAHLTSLINFTRAAPDDQAVTIRLDPKILDETTLHMAISRSRLSLRFQSPVPASRALIYTHANGLAARLESRVKRPTSIEVTA
ncbi:type III secretion HpaP family protein [Caballeronia sp. SEWSISQ10-4 2]|uniref:type III secretion HpaP family protein n=1 Tax=Caballeronia sp. SEWSISQ10-4 2 TaxID=2937438 RepID=UPI00264BF7BD|nr:type III secretion HpaP family protein [Caballeronia sp. SEWSISQ10-4 2]MDN7177119.1 type III secretion HpaP family protein [Caballeronia sp. SEWSISQ10-4 2]